MDLCKTKQTVYGLTNMVSNKKMTWQMTSLEMWTMSPIWKPCDKHFLKNNTSSIAWLTLTLVSSGVRASFALIFALSPRKIRLNMIFDLCTRLVFFWFLERNLNDRLSLAQSIEMLFGFLPKKNDGVKRLCRDHRGMFINGRGRGVELPTVLFHDKRAALTTAPRDPRGLIHACRRQVCALTSVLVGWHMVC